MEQLVTTNTRRKSFGLSKKAILSSAFILLVLLACKKNDSINTRVLEPGTKCNIYDGVFATGDKQPAQPVTVVSIYRKASSGLIYYNVEDSNGVTWQIPDNDLKVLK